MWGNWHTHYTYQSNNLLFSDACTDCLKKQVTYTDIVIGIFRFLHIIIFFLTALRLEELADQVGLVYLTWYGSLAICRLTKWYNKSCLKKINWRLT